MTLADVQAPAPAHLSRLHSPEAEQSVLGALLQDADALTRAAPLEARQFADSRHAAIYAAIGDLARAGVVPDPITTVAKLRERGLDEDVGGLPYLFDLVRSVPSSSSVAYYADIVRDCADRRELAAAADSIRDAAA